MLQRLQRAPLRRRDSFLQWRSRPASGTPARLAPVATQLAFARVATALTLVSTAALAVGALAIGRLAIRSLRLKEGSVERLRIGELEVERLRVRELIREGEFQGPVQAILVDG